MKSKISVKKRIFAFLGVFVALLAILSVCVSADDSEPPLYSDPQYIPHTPITYESPSWFQRYDPLTGISSKRMLFYPEIAVAYTDDNDDPYGVSVPLTRGVIGWSERSSGQIFMRDSNNATTGTVYYANSYVDGDYPVSRTNVDIERNYSSFLGFEMFGGDFWIYPTSNTMEGGDSSYGDIITANFSNSDGENNNVTVSVQWRFLESAIIYTSFYEGLSFTDIGVEIDYLWLMDNCTTEFVKQYHQNSRNLATPVYISQIKITFTTSTSVAFGNIQFEIPCMKAREQQLYLQSGNHLYYLGHDIGWLAGYDVGYDDGIGEGGGDIIVTNPDFDLSMIFSAVSKVLSMPIIGYISFGGIISAFFALSVVLAVLGLFRGST